MDGPLLGLTHASGATDVVVHEVRGVEALNHLYKFSITLSTPFGEDVQGAWIGDAATLHFRYESTARAWHGVIASMRYQGTRLVGGVERAQYRARLVPRPWLLTQRKGSRIFQDLRVDQVLQEVLASALVTTRFELRRTYPVREYCTQYGESDWQFVTRLLAESGFLFFFEQFGEDAAGDPVTGATMVITDDAASYRPIRAQAGESDALAPAFAVARDANRLPGSRTLSWVDRRWAVRPRRGRFAEFDPDRPQVPIVSTADHTSWERAEAPPTDPESQGDRSTRPRDERLGLDWYEHESPYLFPAWDYARDEAVRIVRQVRRKSDVVFGGSRNPRLEPGRTHEINAAPSTDFGGDFAVVRVEHTMKAPDAEPFHYENTFVTVPASVPFVPKLPATRTREVCLTASVVGPTPGAVNADAQGRVQVKFHWDRSAARDGTSCWIRVMQPWAMPNAGFQFMPRVGTEVVVAFDGGDPDKPIVVGGIHNAVVPLPFLPHAPHVSGIRSQTLGGDGHNELSFDDSARAERVHLRAQNRLDVQVLGDHAITVGQRETSHVAGHRSSHVGTDEIHVRGARSTTVGAGDTTSIEGTTATTATEDARITAEGSLELVGRDFAGLASRRQTRVAGTFVHITSKHTENAPGEVSVEAEGFTTVFGGMHLTLKSPAISALGAERVELSAGESSIAITPTGIHITGPAIFLNGKQASIAIEDKGVNIAADDAIAVVASTTTLQGQGSVVTLDASATVEGGAIAFKSGGANAPQASSKSIPPTTIRLKDDRTGKAVPRARFVLLGADGVRREGRLDDNGEAKVLLTDDVRVVFPHHPRSRSAS